MSSPYSVSAGYIGSTGRIPTASAPPPIVERSRKPPPALQSRRPAPRKPRPAESEEEQEEEDDEPKESPYGISTGFNAAKRLIPTASNAPPIREVKKSRVGARTPAPPSLPPPGMSFRRGPSPYAQAPGTHYMQPLYGAPPPPPQWGPPPIYGAPPPQRGPPPEPMQESLEPPPPPLRLELPEGSWDLASTGVAVYHHKELGHLTGSASFILEELVGDITSEVQLEHDADWDQFADIGEAITQAGGEQAAMCVAFCHSQGIWAVGLGGQWRKRENIAKLALCIALVEKSDEADEIFMKYPEFAEFCQAPGASKKRRPKKVVKPPPKKVAPLFTPARPAAKVVPAPPSMADSGSLPRDMPLWITLPDSEPTPVQLEGLTAEALVVCTDGTKRKGLYSGADQALSELVGGDIEGEIEFHDDCNWTVFPAVGALLKEISPKEECMCVAVCNSKMIWAVGVGMKGKSRWQAAKVAIATAIHLNISAMGEDLPDLTGSAIPEFADEAQAAKDEAGL